MKIQTLFRLEIILALLLSAIAMNTLSIYFFTRLDQVVHGDLYRYGLQFSYEWAGQYWTYAKLILGLLGLTITTAAISTTLILTGYYTRQTQFFINRPTLPKINPTKLIPLFLLSTGTTALALSINYNSSILAFIGLGLAFWGALLLYITPTKHVKLELLNATVSSNLTSIEKVIANTQLKGKGIYLPPKYLKDSESSLVFIPSKAEQPLPKPEEIDEEKLYSRNPNGIFLTPPGLTLSKLFEKELGTSFLRIDLNHIQEKLPKLFTEDLEIAENIEIKTENQTITIEITNHVFNEICQETRKLQNTHEATGCPLCSAIACALAKATGKPIKIEKEERSQDGKTTKIQYRMLEE